MTEQTFEERFSSLNEMACGTRLNAKRINERIFTQDTIQEYCLDKQKVRDAIIKFRNNVFDTGEMSKEDRAKLTIKFDILNDELGL